MFACSCTILSSCLSVSLLVVSSFTSVGVGDFSCFSSSKVRAVTDSWGLSVFHRNTTREDTWKWRISRFFHFLQSVGRKSWSFIHTGFLMLTNHSGFRSGSWGVQWNFTPSNSWLSLLLEHPGMLQIWCRGMVCSPNVQVGGFAWSSINSQKNHTHHPRLSLTNRSFHCQHAALN